MCRFYGPCDRWSAGSRAVIILTCDRFVPPPNPSQYRWQLEVCKWGSATASPASSSQRGKHYVVWENGRTECVHKRKQPPGKQRYSIFICLPTFCRAKRHRCCMFSSTFLDSLWYCVCVLVWVDCMLKLGRAIQFTPYRILLECHAFPIWCSWL